MSLSMYDLVYIISNILAIYTIYLFMGIFFDKEKVENRQLEILSYIAYFIVINIFYLVSDVPLILMLCNIISLFMIALNYQATLKQRILSVAFIYIILMGIETVVVLLTENFKGSLFNENDYSIIYGVFCNRIFSYITVLIANGYYNVRKKIDLPIIYWICLFVVPISSLMVMLTIFNFENHSEHAAICVLLLLLINFATFYLYDVIIATLENKVENMYLQQESKYYYKQLEIMENSYSKIKALKHDWVNHLSIIETLLKKSEITEAIRHIEEMQTICKTTESFAKSGNIIVDSILNFKLNEAKSQKINAFLHLNIPTQLKITSFDMAVILGNILDNAMTATNKCKEKKEINLSIKYSRGRLLIKISNTYDGNILLKDKIIKTTKTDKENHGIGLKSVKNILNKYKGTMDVEYSNEVFIVTILMYIEQ